MDSPKPLTCLHEIIFHGRQWYLSAEGSGAALGGQMHSLCTKLLGNILTEITDLEVQDPQHFNKEKT